MYKIMAGIAVYIGINVGISFYMAKDQAGVVVTNPETGESITVPDNLGTIPPYQLRPRHLDEGATYRHLPKTIAPIWPQDSHIDVVVTISPSFNPAPIAMVPAEYVVLNEKRFHMNNKTDKRSIDTTFTVPESVQNNGTLWGHFYVGLAGSVLDPHLPNYDPGRAYHVAHPLTQYLGKKKSVQKRNLLEDLPSHEQEVEEVDKSGPTIASYYHQNASFSLVPALGVKELDSIHPALKTFLRLEATGARDGSGQNGWYCMSLILAHAALIMSKCAVD
jgi:hypothetical protein